MARARRIRARHVRIVTSVSSSAPSWSGRVPVSFEVPDHTAELLADHLFSLGAAAVAELDAVAGATTLVADLSPEDAAELLDGPLVAQWELRSVRVLEDDRAWNSAWREHARAWECGPRFVLRPPWVPAPQDGTDAATRLELVVDPGDAFGSGSHPTTRRCVELIGELVVGGESVLDVGCGSGVLSVAAALAGASSVLAVDVDPEAVRATPQVAARNGVADRVQVRLGSLEAVEGRHDLVLANLLIPIIEQMGAGLVEVVAPGGRLVISGVLESQAPRVATALQGLTVERQLLDGDWMTLVLAAPHVG